MHRYLFLLFFLSFSSLSESYGQSVEFHFHHFTTDDGLTHNTVYAINQDSLGFIWIGTRSGLNRYDGAEFRTYGTDHGLKDIFVNTIFRDSRSRMWVGTQEGGISLYHPETDRFSTWMFSDSGYSSYRRDNILSIAEDPHGRIWAGSHAGNIFLPGEQPGNFFTLQIRATDGILPDRIHSLEFRKDGTLLAGCFNGLFRIRLSQEEGVLIGNSERMLTQWVSIIREDRLGRLWMGTSSGLYSISENEEPELFNRENSELSGNRITDIEFIGDGQLLVSTDGGGISVLNTQTGNWKAYKSDPNNQYSLSNNSVFTVFEDRDHALWIGNWSGGINYYSPDQWKFNLVRHRFNDQESLSDNHVRTFFEDTKGGIWIGTLGGLNLFDKSTGKFKMFTAGEQGSGDLSSNTILSIYEPSPEELWIGTFGGGLNIYNRESGIFSRYHHPDDQNRSLEEGSIYQMIELEGRWIVLATLGGFYMIDRTEGTLRRFTVSNSPLTNNTIKALAGDSKGELWIGTNRGVNRYNPKNGAFKSYLHSNDNPGGLSNNRILSILEDRKGRVWIGTEGGGISIIDPLTEKFSYLQVSDGLPDNVINSLQQDPSGAFWISTNKGLVRYVEEERSMTIYTTSEGLQGNEFYQNSSLIASDGTLYFGGPYGFNYFNPDRIGLGSKVPQVMLTDFYYSGHLVREFSERSVLQKQLYLTDEIRMPYNATFEIHFSVPGTPNLNKYTFSYILEGNNESWSEYQVSDFVNFANLGAGRYTFRVRALNNEGIESGNDATIRIRIMAPWWKTWWVFIIYAATLATLIFILLNLNNSKIRARHALEVELQEKQQKEAVNQLKLRFFTDISHEFKTPLTLILGSLDNLKGAAGRIDQKTFSGIGANARRLLSLINQLLEFRKAESGLMKLQASKASLLPLARSIMDSFSQMAKSKRIDITIESTGTIPELWFDKEKMEKILYNLISNAFKYTPEGGSIELILSAEQSSSLQASKGTLSIILRDTGIGIPPEEQDRIFDRFYHGNPIERDHRTSVGSGIGLALTRRLVELHHGTIHVESEPGRGAAFTVRLPLGKDHLTEDEIRADDDYHLRMDYSTELLDDDSDEGRELPDPEIDRSRPLVLIVDDNPALRQVITEKFQDQYTVISASDGKAGFERARLLLPDIILSDVMMPEMDGLRLCELLKTSMITSHIPVILLTVRNEEEDRILGFETGADAYIAKPYHPDLLRATVENLLNSRRILRKKYSAQSSNVPPELIGNRLDEEFLEKLVATIENGKFTDHLDVTTLCSELAMSRSALYRKVKMLTDNSIQEFIRLVKLRKAARLLRTSGMPVSEIAYISGFTNTKHFSTAFKKLYAKTPSAYRQAGADSSGVN